MKNISRRGRVSAAPRFQLSPGVSRAGVSVTTGTPASEFVALAFVRLSSRQRRFHSVPRTVALRLFASAYPNFPRCTLRGVLAQARRAARSETLQRISERFAGQIEARMNGPGLSSELLVKPRRHAERLAVRRWPTEFE